MNKEKNELKDKIKQLEADLEASHHAIDHWYRKYCLNQIKIEQLEGKLAQREFHIFIHKGGENDANTRRKK